MFRRNYTSNLKRIYATTGIFGYNEDEVDNGDGDDDDDDDGQIGSSKTHDDRNVCGMQRGGKSGIRSMTSSSSVSGMGDGGIGRAWTNKLDRSEGDRLKTDNKLDHISTVMNIKVWPLDDNEQINNEKDMVYRLQAIAEKINAYYGKKVRMFQSHLRPTTCHNARTLKWRRIVSVSDDDNKSIEGFEVFAPFFSLFGFIFLMTTDSRLCFRFFCTLPFQQMVFSILSGFVCITVQLYYLLNHIRNKFRSDNAELLALTSVTLILQHSLEFLTTFIIAQMVKKKWKKSIYTLQLLKIEVSDQRLKRKVRCVF